MYVNEPKAHPAFNKCFGNDWRHWIVWQHCEENSSDSPFTLDSARPLAWWYLIPPHEVDFESPSGREPLAVPSKSVAKTRESRGKLLAYLRRGWAAAKKRKRKERKNFLNGSARVWTLFWSPLNSSKINRSVSTPGRFFYELVLDWLLCSILDCLAL